MPRLHSPRRSRAFPNVVVKVPALRQSAASTVLYFHAPVDGPGPDGPVSLPEHCALSTCCPSLRSPVSHVTSRESSHCRSPAALRCVQACTVDLQTLHAHGEVTPQVTPLLQADKHTHTSNTHTPPSSSSRERGASSQGLGTGLDVNSRTIQSTGGKREGAGEGESRGPWVQAHPPHEEKIKSSSPGAFVS